MKRPRTNRPLADKPSLPLASRIFAVLAAVLLVGAVALASLLPPDMTLRGALEALNDANPDALQHAVVAVVGTSLWQNVLVPLLVRPSWMIPLCLGLICVGGAVTAHSQATPRTKQRRS